MRENCQINYYKMIIQISFLFLSLDIYHLFSRMRIPIDIVDGLSYPSILTFYYFLFIKLNYGYISISA